MGRRVGGWVVTALAVGCSSGGAAETSGGTSTMMVGSTSAGAGLPTTSEAAGSSTTSGASGGVGSSSGWSSTGVETGSSSEDAGETGSSSTGVVPTLRVEPAAVQVVVSGGWSVPAQFSARLAGEEEAVAAAWTIDAPEVGRITRYGGSFAARNTAGGTVQVTAEFAGQVATAEVEVVLVDDRPVCPPRPPLTEGAPGPGTFVKVVAPEYAGTGVYHGVYLPPGWTPERRMPVIVESPCNKYGTFSGKVEDTRMGYHWSGCRDYVWIVMPYILNGANLDNGWGDAAATLEYWRLNVPRTIAQIGGDPGAVLVTGFSRGAIGASWVGLYDDGVAEAWLGFFMHSHADAPGGLTPDGGAGAASRLQRVAGRASLLAWGADGDGGATNSMKGAALLESLGYPLQTLAVPGVGHTEAWMIDDAASRETAQGWLFATTAARPGTGAVYGRVVDAMGVGVAGVRVAAGAMRWDTSDSAGYFGLRGLAPGAREIGCAADGCAAAQVIEVVANGDVEDVVFVRP